MAIRSAYVIITEEQDGFVAVDYDLVGGYGGEEEDRRHDLTAWELVGEDDVSEAVEFSGSDVSSECCGETIVGEDVESLPELGLLPVFDDVVGGDEESVPETMISLDYPYGEDAKSVTGSITSPEYMYGDIVGEDAKLLTGQIISPEYSDETVAGEDAMLPDCYQCTTEKIGGYNATTTTHRSRGEKKYCYEEDDDVEEDDYDLDDELVPYYVNGKLGRERMRKLGKRSCTKAVKSKRLTYNYNKAGCFRGKHGLGLKHSLI